MELKDRLISLFGKDWYEVMSSYLHSPSFLDIGKRVFQERQNYKVYPESPNVFRAFRETGYYQTKVVLVGQDVYHTGIANGLAFCCRDSEKLSPSLRIILREIDNEYPENIDRIDFGRLDKWDLSRWARQGVFLINKALTVREGQPGSHIQLWEPFLKEVIKAINKRNDIIFILLGKDAQELEPLVSESNYVLKAPHPAAEVYRSNAGFLGSDIFKNCNTHLINTNRREIEW